MEYLSTQNSKIRQSNCFIYRRKYIWQKFSNYPMLYAFENCESLERIVIPESVQKIGLEAFENCKNLKEVLIPKGCEVDPSAFDSTCKITY